MKPTFPFVIKRRYVDAFVVLDCGGGSCDVTTRLIVEDNKIGELCESDASMPGGNSVDEKYLRLVANRMGIDPGRMNEIRQKHYDLVSRFVEQTFMEVKKAFDGTDKSFRFRVDMEDYPKLRGVCQPKRSGKNKNTLLTITYADVKSFFDEAVNSALGLLRYVYVSNICLKKRHRRSFIGKP
jgi:hypothetical protein